MIIRGVERTLQRIVKIVRCRRKQTPVAVAALLQAGLRVRVAVNRVVAEA